MQTDYSVIGLMSGTSLDGLDVALCHFTENSGSWSYEILCACTFPYSEEWKSRLQNLENASAFEYALTNVELGHLFGKKVNEFMRDHAICRNDVDFISSHGHTVFHRPELGLTTQIADINAIAAETALPVVGDFRTLDVALGGQGAPLVPVGDRLLFAEYSSCLNLGGIANISFTENGRRVAFDISPCNMILNHLAEKLGKKYDEDGRIAQSGSVNNGLLARLDALQYYEQDPPKSLGKEWFLQYFLPLVEESEISVADALATSVEHIARQIAGVLNGNGLETLVVTGGGAFNRFLVERLRNCTGCRITVPDSMIINYKEAMIFAFLGILRMRGESNCLSSVTGARTSNCGGVCSGVF